MVNSDSDVVHENIVDGCWTGIGSTKNNGSIYSIRGTC